MNWKMFWKLLICCAIFLASIFVVGVVLDFFGFGFPVIAYWATPILMWVMISGFLLTILLSWFSRNLQVNWFFRWIILEMYLWEVGIVGLIFSAFFFPKTGLGLSLRDFFAMVFGALLPSLILSAVVAFLFRPKQPFSPCWQNFRDYYFTQKKSSLFWRIIAALIAYPMVLFVSKLIVQMIFWQDMRVGIIEMPQQGWALMLLLQLIQSILFLGASLPMIIWWQGTRQGLRRVLWISFLLFPVLMIVLFAGWDNVQLNLGIIIRSFSTAFVYIEILTILFGQSTRSKDAQHFGYLRARINMMTARFRQEKIFVD